MPSLPLLLRLAIVSLAALSTLAPLRAQQNWTWANSLPASSGWKDVAFGNGVYVAVGTDATIATSPDGATWTIRRMSTGQTVLNGVEFAAGRFVAVGSGSPTRTGAALILTSTDGITWTTVDSVAAAISAQLTDVAYGNGLWVVTGFGGTRILTSADTATWTQRALPSGIGIPSKIAFGGGRFVTTSSNNNGYTSTDGITWSNISVAPANSQLEAVAFGGGKFVMVGRDNTFNAAAYTSTDGTTWSAANAISGAAGGVGFIAVAGNASGFVAAGGQLLYSSADGVTWTARTPALPLAPRQLDTTREGVEGAAFAGTQFFVTGDSGSITSSTDGTTWTRRSTGTVADLGAVLHDGNRFVASGSGGTILTSTDGTAWTQLTTGATADFSQLAFGNNRYVTAGFNGIYHSTNLTTWTLVAGTASNRWTAAAYGNGRFLVANSATTLGVRSSTDGATWSAAVQISGAGGNTNGLTFGNGIFVLTMAGFSSTPFKIYTSTDGTGWTQRAADLVPVGTGLFSTAFGAGRFVILTGVQTALISTDGLQWRVARLPSSVSLTRIRFLGGRFYASAATYGSPSYSSADGENWSQVSDSFGPNILVNQSSTATYPNFAAKGDTVVAVGAQGMILRGNLAATPPPAAARLINLSVLTSIASAGDNFTLGYVVGGVGTSGAKPLVIRAAGPSLGALGVSGTLDDPKMELFAGSTKTSENDNWGGSADLATALASVGAFAYTGPTSKDAAATASITTRDNSVKVSASGSGTGSVIAEVYDATPSANFTATTPRLLNVSVIKNIGAKLTAGFVIGGSGTKTVLIRAVGPGLSAVGVTSGFVPDPQLVLYGAGAVKLDENNDWGGTAALTDAAIAVGAFAIPANSKDAVLLKSLAPGNYSVEVTGAGGASGVAVIEVYDVP